MSSKSHFSDTQIETAQNSDPAADHDKKPVTEADMQQEELTDNTPPLASPAEAVDIHLKDQP